MTAVCSVLVVAPPIKRGTVRPARRISWATWVISAREGVISPLSPMKSTPSRTAVSMIVRAGTMTPRSTTW